MRTRITLLVLLVLVCWSSAVGASPILAVVGSSGGYTENAHGGVRWLAMTAQLNAAFGGSSNVTVLPVAAGLLGFDAVWVDQRLGPTLSPSELGELSAFTASGRRIVMIGENNSWDAWNLQILGIVGGGYVGGCFWPVSAPVVSHPLTAGVSAVEEVCGSTATGGTALFSDNFATLWGAGNVLTILDSNMMDDSYRTHHDNAIFFGNVATWLAAGSAPPPPAVPEPATLVLTGLGLAGLRLWRKRQG